MESLLTHDISLAKLLIGNANNWFKSYLTNGVSMCVTMCLNGHTSNEDEINIGVPQESVLGSLLMVLISP